MTLPSSIIHIIITDYHSGGKSAKSKITSDITITKNLCQTMSIGFKDLNLNNTPFFNFFKQII